MGWLGAAEFGDAPWLWVSASCRASARPAASCQGLEWDGGLAGQAGTALGLPVLTACARCWEGMALPGGGNGGGLAPPAPVLLPPRSQAEGRMVWVVLLRCLTLFISSAGCRVPRSSVPNATPSHLPETFGASTYEGPSGRAGPSYSAQLITPRGRRTTATKKKDVLKM